MIRPAERFAVNIVREEPALRLTRPARWASLPALVGLAVVLGIGAGGMLPARWPGMAALRPGATDPAAIEPAAGPSAPLELVMAPDRHFYAPVLVDRVPVAMLLEPNAAETLLSPSDAGRLAVGGAAGPLVEVGEIALGGARLGPVRLRVGPPETGASVLGADLLDRLAVVAVEGERLRLSPR